jgi:spore coat assembly protein
MRQGDLVIRKSYGGDVIFKIQAITAQQALLKGVDYRLLADAPVEDLQEVGETEYLLQTKDMRARADRAFHRIERSQQLSAQKNIRNLQSKLNGSASFFEVPGKVLHVDGDYSYLQKCMILYQELQVPAHGYYVSEPNMASALQVLLPKVRPDIVVITGHDGLLKNQTEGIHSLNSYKNSHNFVKAVETARAYEHNRDSLVVVAGACQSHFEALLNAGSNFASSPARVLIHALDPLYIACKVAFTSIKETVHMMDIIRHTLSGLEGIGGLETRGFHRLGLPKVTYKHIEKRQNLNVL